MCGGVLYQYQARQIITCFSTQRAKLPVLTGNRRIALFLWGRRKQEPGRLPLGGWASLADIRHGKWQRYFPKPVKLTVHSFMETDIEACDHWFEVTAGQYVQGLLARYQREMRVYVVTIIPERADASFKRWPRILSG